MACRSSFWIFCEEAADSTRAELQREVVRAVAETVTRDFFVAMSSFNPLARRLRFTLQGPPSGWLRGKRRRK
jgi:hypothetical protein